MDLLNPTTFLLDVDGTLIESNMQHAEAWFEAFQDSDLNIDFEEIRQSIGKGGDQILPELANLDPHSSRAKEIERRRGEIFRTKHLPHLHANDKSVELLKVLIQKGYQLVIATSSDSRGLQAMLRQTGLDGIVHEATTASDSKASKPEPDIVLAALRKAQCLAARAVMIGDTPYDMIAATKAGVSSIGFACGGWTKTELEAAGASVVFEGPADFLNRAETSILNWEKVNANTNSRVPIDNLRGH